MSFQFIKPLQSGSSLWELAVVTLKLIDLESHEHKRQSSISSSKAILKRKMLGDLYLLLKYVTAFNCLYSSVRSECEQGVRFCVRREIQEGDILGLVKLVHSAELLQDGRTVRKVRLCPDGSYSSQDVILGEELGDKFPVYHYRAPVPVEFCRIVEEFKRDQSRYFECDRLRYDLECTYSPLDISPVCDI